MKKSISSRYLLPMMITMGVLVVFVRVGDVWDAIETGKFLPHPAMAETTPEKTEAPAAEAAKTAPPAATGTTAASAPPVEPPAYVVDDQDRSPAEIEVLNQLSQRRDSLDKRAKDLDTHEALLKVAEQRVDQKIKEMNTLRTQLQAMVNLVGEAQAAQVENLVKIYETMKPDEAAKIFETLDLPVLLGVVQRMKPARTAPIMAKMTPEKAKEITIALTRQDQLPQIK